MEDPHPEDLQAGNATSSRSDQRLVNREKEDPVLNNRQPAFLCSVHWRYA
jgi:hypothetical protein